MRLNKSDMAVLKEANHRRGYGRFKASALKPGSQKREWNSCLKLQSFGFIEIEGNGEAEDFIITAKGKRRLRKAQLKELGA